MKIRDLNLGRRIGDLDRGLVIGIQIGNLYLGLGLLVFDWAWVGDWDYGFSWPN